MKPFWKRPAKKKPKATARPKSTPQKRSRPEPWVPPHPEALKRRVTPIPQNIEKATDRSKSIPEKIPDGKTSENKLETRAEFLKVFHQFSSLHRGFDIWKDFVTIFACAISNATDKEHFDERENRYLATIKKYSKQDQSLFPKLAALTVEALEENPEQDFLGELYTRLDFSDKGKQQIFTPYHVAGMMARMTMTDIPTHVRERGYFEVTDPCCGGGVTLIAAINEARRQLEKEDMNFQNHILVSGQDIDETVLMMCYIQVSLLGVAGYFKVGNSLTEPMASGDSNENYWFTTMYCISPIWQYRRIFQTVDKLTEKGEVE